MWDDYMMKSYIDNEIRGRVHDAARDAEVRRALRQQRAKRGPAAADPTPQPARSFGWARRRVTPAGD